MADSKDQQSFAGYVLERYEGGQRAFFKSKVFVTILLAFLFLTIGYVFSEKPKGLPKK